MQRILQEILKTIILGTSDAWSTSRLSHRPSKPAYYIVDCQISSKGEQRTEEEARIEKGRKTLVTMLVVEDNFQNFNLRLGIQTKVPSAIFPDLKNNLLENSKFEVFVRSIHNCLSKIYK